jgi:ATP-binding cassette subfamily C protein
MHISNKICIQTISKIKMKYQVVRQYSEEDCGAASLATIAKYYKRFLTLNHVREIVGTGQLGTTMLGLRRGAESLGFNAQSVKTSPEILDRLSEAPLPAIIHWKGNHWVVLYGKKGKKYIIGDPGTDIRYIDKQELSEGWKNWVMLLLEPDETRFKEQADDKKAEGFSRFFKRIWSHRLNVITALLCAAIIGLLSLASPFLLQILTDDILVRGDFRLLTTMILVVMLVNIVSIILQVIQQNLIANFAQHLELGLVLDFGRQILRLPLTYYETRRSGEITSRLQDIQEINQLVAQVVVTLPSQLFIAAISLAFMLSFSFKLTVVAAIVAGLMTLSTFAFLPTLRQKVRRLLVLDSENQGILVESFKGALTLKTTSSAPQFWEEFQSRFGRLANLILKTLQISIINNNFSLLVSSIGSTILLWFGSTLVIGKELTIGQLLAFITMNRNFLNFISTCVNLVDEYTRVQTATQRLIEVIDATPETKEESKKRYVEISDRAKIVCDHLNFHYPGRVELLEDFSIAIPGGQVVALIGRSGCGKSSIAKMIAGLYAPKSGNIRIGAYNLQDLALECLRQQVVLVPQEPHFWSRSIIDNFTLGNPQLRFGDIVQACQIVDADDFISKLPDKYDTVLGEFGANISGGQRQRLALARAIVNDPPILILDESTSGLDPVTEARVLSRLLSYRHSKTTILISHRPRVILKADWIALLEEGKVKFQGTVTEFQASASEDLDFITP